MNITNSSGFIIAELKQAKVAGLPGVGCYTLVINLEFLVNNNEGNQALRNSLIRVEWGDDTQSILGNCPPEHGQPIPIPSARSFNVGFKLPISREQLEAIEARRSGTDFSLHIWFFAELACGTAAGKPVADRTLLQISQSEWVKCLENMGYQKSLLMEFSLPQSLHESASLHNLVVKARAHFLNGRYNECVAECRKILEANSLLNPDNNLTGVARKKFSVMDRNEPDNRESMSSKERLLVLRDAIKHAANYPHHLREDEVEYDRHEARIIFYAVLAVLPLAQMGI